MDGWMYACTYVRVYVRVYVCSNAFPSEAEYHIPRFYSTDGMPTLSEPSIAQVAPN